MMWGIQGIFGFAICKLFCDKIALSQQQNLDAVKRGRNRGGENIDGHFSAIHRL